MPYKVNGMDIELAEPVLTDGTTFVPVADLANAMGGYVDWNHEAKTARIEIGDKVGFIHNDNETAEIGGEQVALHAKPYIVDGVLWAPVRVFRDGFGIGLNVDGGSIELTR